MHEEENHPYIGRGASFFVLVALLVSFLLSCGYQQQTASPSKSTSLRSKLTSTTTVKVLPTPSTKPISAAVSSGHSTLPVIANGVAYVGTGDNAFYALQARDGKLLWRIKIDGAVVDFLVAADGVIYVSTYVGQSGPANLYALRASDGVQIWEYHAGNDSISAPVVEDGLAYISAPNGVMALRASNGTQAWHFIASGEAYISSLDNGVLYASAHVGDNGPGSAYALRASDGQLLWSYTSSNPLDPPDVIDGMAYIGAWDGTLYALQASNGKLLWHSVLSGDLLDTQEVNGVLYVLTQKEVLYEAIARNSVPASSMFAISGLLGAMDPARKMVPDKEFLSYLYAVRVSDGTILWQNALNSGKDSYANGFSVDNGQLYGSEQISTGNNTTLGEVYALRSTDGSPIWQDEVNAYASGEQVANGIIYVSGGNDLGNATALYALQERDGSLLWSYPLAARSTNVAIPVGDIVYIGADNGMVYALAANGGKLLWHYQTDAGS